MMAKSTDLKLSNNSLFKTSVKSTNDIILSEESKETLKRIQRIKAVGIVTLLISLIPFITGIVGLRDDGSRWFGSLPTGPKIVFPLYLVISIFMFVFSISIIQKITKGDPFFFSSVMYLLAFIIVFAICAAGGAVSLNQVTKFPDKDSCQKNHKQIWPDKLMNNYKMSIDYFCVQGRNCRCSITNPSELISDWTQAPYQNWQYTDTFAAVSAFQCADLLSSYFNQESVIVLKSLENLWGCSGICEALPYYAFSNINRGKPLLKQSCYAYALSQMEDLVDVMAWPILVVELILISCLVVLEMSRRYLDRDPNFKKIQDAKRIQKILPTLKPEDIIKLTEQSQLPMMRSPLSNSNFGSQYQNANYFIRQNSRTIAADQSRNQDI